jgi:hypothetical protein
MYDGFCHIHPQLSVPQLVLTSEIKYIHSVAAGVFDFFPRYRAPL